MFENCSDTIKGLAKGLFWLCIVGAIIILIAELLNPRRYLFGSAGTSVILIVVLLFNGFIVPPFLYGFGVIIDCVEDISYQIRKSK